MSTDVEGNEVLGEASGVEYEVPLTVLAERCKQLRIINETCPQALMNFMLNSLVNYLAVSNFAHVKALVRHALGRGKLERFRNN